VGDVKSDLKRGLDRLLIAPLSCGGVA
jgi:hypothetical protein